MGPAGEPVMVRDHDFPDKDQEYAIPYGIYDEKGNAGFVNVGTGGNTAALAAESIRRWWNLAGKAAYPDAGRLLVTCDAGGSNGYANTAWRAGLAELARETGLEIEVCHFPPGTSKWNKIEHRLFCQITLAWRGRPLTSYDVIIDTIGNVTTRHRPGRARRSSTRTSTPPGRKPGSDQHHEGRRGPLVSTPPVARRVELHPPPGPGRDAPPPPEPARAAAPGCQPGRTGPPRPHRRGPRRRSALAAALASPHAARRERDTHIRRGGELTGTPGSGRKARNGPADYLQALLIRRHLAVPNPVLAALLGTRKDALSRQLTRTSALLAAAGLTLPPAAQPPPPPVRALDGLREYAARHGITINAPPPAAGKPPDTTLTTPTRHKLTLFLNMPTAWQLDHGTRPLGCAAADRSGPHCRPQACHGREASIPTSAACRNQRLPRAPEIPSAHGQCRDVRRSAARCPGSIRARRALHPPTRTKLPSSVTARGSRHATSPASGAA